MIGNILITVFVLITLALAILRLFVIRGGRGIEFVDPKSFIQQPEKSTVTAEQTENDHVQVSWSKENAAELQLITLPQASSELLSNSLKDKSNYLHTTASRTDRQIYKVTFENGDSYEGALRFWRLDGIINLRDLGGYKTNDGRETAWGKIYRTGHLGRATSESLQILSDYGIATVCDLRSKRERNENPDRVPEGASYLELSIYEDDQLSAIFPKLLFDRSSLADQLGAGYIKMLDERPERFGKIIHQISHNMPAMYHCTAGKDRVGLTSAMILSLLGVPRETIIGDFTLSNLASEALFTDFMSSSAATIKKFGIPPNQLRPLFAAEPQWMVNALAHLDNQFGGVRRYLIDAGKLSQESIDLLRERMLV